MKPHRYLTKSRFKLGIECPTKLYYTGKSGYSNQKLDDPFLSALADGGYQVGELAKLYFPNGHDITTLDYKEAEIQTLKLLEQKEVVIYEPAIRFENLFIRVDVLVKKGNRNNKLNQALIKIFLNINTSIFRKMYNPCNFIVGRISFNFFF